MVISRDFRPIRITAAEVRELRESAGISIMEAKKRLTKERKIAALCALKESGTIEDKVEFLLEELEKQWS